MCHSYYSSHTNTIRRNRVEGGTILTRIYRPGTLLPLALLGLAAIGTAVFLKGYSANSRTTSLSAARTSQLRPAVRETSLDVDTFPDYDHDGKRRVPAKALHTKSSAPHKSSAKLVRAQTPKSGKATGAKSTSNSVSKQSTTTQTQPKPHFLFHLRFQGNMQGIAYHNGHVYVGFDLGKGTGEIREYTLGGTLVKVTPPLAIGHTASLTFDNQSGDLYVVNGGSTHPTTLYQVAIDTPSPHVVRTLNWGKFGNSGLIAIDNSTHTIWLETAPNDHGPITFRHCDFSGTVLQQFQVPNLGVPQGLDFYQGHLYYYTDNTITELTESGHITKTLHVALGGESEGLAVVTGAKPAVIFGFHSPNRIYTIDGVSPA